MGILLVSGSCDEPEPAVAVSNRINIVPGCSDSISTLRAHSKWLLELLPPYALRRRWASIRARHGARCRSSVLTIRPHQPSVELRASREGTGK